MKRAVGAHFLSVPVTWADGPGWYKPGPWPLVLRKGSGKVQDDKAGFQPYWGNPPYGMIRGVEETSA